MRECNLGTGNREMAKTLARQHCANLGLAHVVARRWLYVRSATYIWPAFRIAGSHGRLAGNGSGCVRGGLLIAMVWQASSLSRQYRAGLPRSLGALEDCATSENAHGVRTYAFFDQRKLSRLGRKGHLASIFLPAKLGSPAMCRTLTDNQHRLLQAIIQETTRNRKGNQNETTTAAIAENANVPDFGGATIDMPTA